MSPLQVTKFSLTTTTHGTPLLCTIKRYRRSSRTAPGPKEPAAILLLGHGTGFPKEIWEPTIEDLFGLDDTVAVTVPGGLRIREAWALDCQNHGEAAIINAGILVKDPSLLDIHDYADAFATLYKSGLLGKLDPEFDKVILAGHSAGSVGVTLATSHFDPPSKIPFDSLILIDTPIFSPEMRGQETEMYKLVRAMTPERKDRWTSREAAIKWMQARPPWTSWDPRVFDIYTRYGLQPLPTPYYPDKQGVTLTTHRSGENIAFTGEIFALSGLYRLNAICSAVPVHLIYGDDNDMFDREVQDSIINPKEGRSFASVTRIPGAGHLVPEEAPLKLAKVMFAILRKLPQRDSNIKL